MKKTIIMLSAMVMLAGAIFAEAPELKNMMPNSWRKLERLSEGEESAFVSQGEGKKSMDGFKKKNSRKYYWKDSIDFRIYRETVCGIEFYRLLICDGELKTFFSQTYGDRIFGDYKSAEYDKFFDMKVASTAQIVFVKGRDNGWKEIWNMPLRKYSVKEPMITPWTDIFSFYDLMIRKLNEREIGFFTTKAMVSISENYGTPKPTSDGIRWTGTDGPLCAYYEKIKGQLAGSSTMYFTKRNADEEISGIRSIDEIIIDAKDEIIIDASDYLFDSKCPLKYSIQNAFDGDPATSYVENTEDDLMKITFRGCGEKYSKNTRVSIINGYAANEKLYVANNRIKTFHAIGYMLSVAGDKLIPQNPISLELKDRSKAGQIIDFHFNIGLEKFDFKVTELYKGEKYNDTCMAELNVKFDNGSWLFGDIDD